MTKNPLERSKAYHLLLPLLQLPKTSLGPTPENVVNAYLGQEEDVLVVEVQDRRDCSPAVFSSPLYVHDYEFNSSQWIHFHFPSHFLPEVALFRQGKYSQFSPQAKQLFQAQWANNYPNTGDMPREEGLLYWAMQEVTHNATNYWIKRLGITRNTLEGVELYYLPNKADFIEV